MARKQRIQRRTAAPTRAPDDLAGLLAPATVDEFVRRFRAKRVALFRARRGDRLQSLLDWPTVNDLLMRDGFDVSRVKLVRNGAMVARFLYMEHEPPPRLSLTELSAILGKGATLVIDSIDAMIPGLRRLCAAVERRLRARAWINAYLTFLKGGGFGPHWDNHDVLILQVSGAKRWSFFDSPQSYPLRAIRSGETPPGKATREMEVRAGDVLFVPRGHWHDAEVIGEQSVHLTMGLNSRTGVDWAAFVGAQTTEDEIFRQDLPVLGTRRLLEEHVARLKERLIERVRAASVEDFLLDSDTNRETVATINLGLPLKLPDGAGIRTVLRTAPALATDGPPRRATLRAGGATIGLSRAAAETLKRLDDADGLTLASLRTTMARRLRAEEVDAAVAELAGLGLVAIDVGSSRRQSR